MTPHPDRLVQGYALRYCDIAVAARTYRPIVEAHGLCCDAAVAAAVAVAARMAGYCPGAIVAIAQNVTAELLALSLPDNTEGLIS